MSTIFSDTIPGAVPKTMPFDIPYGKPIALDEASRRIAEAKRHNWKMVIAVVDPAGATQVFEDAASTGPAILSLDGSEGLNIQDAVAASAAAESSK